MPIGQSILDAQFDFIDEVIATEIEICLKINRQYTSDKLPQLSAIKFDKKQDKKIIKLPIWFDDHDDWNNVLEHTQVTQSKYIEFILSSVFDIAMFGFLPGFVYLNGLKPELHVPRKKTPAKYIAADSLALGDKYLGIYSLPSPGGWHVIGKLACSVLDIPALPPLKIKGSDQIKFEAITQEQFDNIKSQKISLESYNGIL